MHDWHTRRPLRQKLLSKYHKTRWHFLTTRQVEEWIKNRVSLHPYFWLFILGSNNSGTTVLANLLATHPIVRQLPVEGQWLTRMIKSYKHDSGLNRIWGTVVEEGHWTEAYSADAALRVKYDWALWYPKRPGILLEKSPTGSVKARWYQEHFRPARFISLFRHPFAVCEGISRRTGCTIETAALHYQGVIGVMLEDMTYLQSNLVIKYETLVENTEVVISNLERFLDLPCPFDKTKLSSLGAHSLQGQTTGLTNLNQKSLERLSSADRGIIIEITRDQMKALDYRSDGT